MAGPTRAQLRREVAHSLRSCASAMDGLAHRFATAADVHPTDLQALELLAARRADPPTIGEVGAALELSSGAVTGLVDRLVSAGHVERVADPADRRRVRLQMTEGAHALATDVFGSYAERLDRAMQGMTVDELSTIVRFLDAATAAADEPGSAVG